MIQTTTKNYLYKRNHGPLLIPMTNDYQFRAMMQMNEKVLRGLICALMHLEEEQIISIEIKNSIELGTYIEDKDFILDVKILLNNYIIINLELQVVNEHNWKERSMLYMCRAFDNINSGENYLEVKPAVQIGLLDFPLFEGEQEFYASYMLMNTKSHRVYSDKLRLNVLELKASDLATEEDKKWKIDKWAKFFKAKTWEEIEMLAHELPILEEAAETVYHISQNDRIREQCEAREDFFRRQRTTELLIERQNKEILEQKKELSKLDKELSKLDKELSKRDKELSERDKELSKRDKELLERDKELAEQKKLLVENDRKLKKLEELLVSKGIDPNKI